MKSKRPKPITLERLAQMMQREFESIRSSMATKQELSETREELKMDFQALSNETQAGFAYMNITLDKHMGEVRKTTDPLVHRVKRLEEAVFKKR